MSEKWNDDRLDELNRRVINVEQAVKDMPAMQQEMKGLRKDLDRNTKATEKLDEKLDVAVTEPLKRAKELQNRLVVGLASAAGAGLIVAAATGAFH